MTHFTDKADEFGIKDPFELCRAIRASILTDSGWADPVVPGFNDTTIYRLELDEGIFFVPAADDGWPRTILTHEDVKRIKRGRKMSKRYHESSPMECKRRRRGRRPMED